jgi:outer membrane protein, heavy metal efflux system
MWGSSKRAYQRLLLVSVTSLVVMCGMTARASAEGLTVDDAVRLALQNNPALQAQQHTITVAEGEWRQARTFPNNPRLEWEGRGGRERNETRQEARTYTVKLSQEFPLGGKWRQRIQIAGAGLDRTRWDVQNAQRELVKEVKETFYRILFLEEKRAFADQALALAQQLLHLAEERYRVGESAQVDVNLARVEGQNVQRQRLEVLSQLTQTRATLNRLLGRPPEAPVTVSGTLDTPAPPLDVEQLHHQALQQRPDLRSRNAAVEAATGEVALAQAQRVPDIEVAFIFEREETGANVKQTFGGGIALPLPLWNRNAGGIAAAQARTRVAELERTALQQAVTSEVANTVTELQRLRASLQLFQETILPQSQENLALLRQAFTAGEVGIVPLITEQRAFIAISNEYLETRFAYRTTLVALESILGGVTP